MIRVVYETRSLDDLQAKPVRCAEVVSGCELNIANSTLRGVPIRIFSTESWREEKIIKTTPAIRPSNRKCFTELRTHLSRHFRRSRWKALVLMVVDDFIRELEWEEVLREAGFRTKPFSYHWHHFKKQFTEALRWSPATQKMIPRLEQQDWLQPYMVEDNKI
ncbi:hypothetical protein BIZ83_gp188 [Erwinia phage vB_EamM_ChrisDB]|uniref:hypothetical protein n=1 Tax=Erwinia phage vB_EamM_ChrisDB TaxID=1883371 RepID=UPI00081D2F77|nr:hypothetical protein BIZ83_gp188 [Erwinia phage vB_EamM_ChrisDB]ANZ48665.1 hypothetical protein CHRISDB_103 [Erwinia phage vB_EamM_ChrisDB]